MLGVHCCLGAFSDRIDHHDACVFIRMVDSTLPTAGAGQFKRALVLQILPQRMTVFGVRSEGRRLLDELRGAAGELTEIVFRVRRQFDAKRLSGRFALQLDARSSRFAPGNPGGPGRPRRQTERAYLAIISEACPPEAWRQIVELTVKQAKNGQEKAREWLASYLVGKPEHPATTLHGLAVEEETGTDPIASDAKERRRFAELFP